jgi:hypothetical protein
MEWKFTEDDLRRLLNRIAARDAPAPNGRPGTPQLQHRNSAQSTKSRSQDHVGKQASKAAPQAKTPVRSADDALGRPNSNWRACPVAIVFRGHPHSAIFDQK